jgi:D-xylose 1-dehydrogenase (NADP+, D-xylono-1,5-lactone-forming)
MRWGILGVAGINEAFVPGLLAAGGSEPAAIASRSLERAREQADRWGIPRAYGAYADVLADDGVDAVYIPLPNHLHAEWTVRALRAGKHVLCEKPLAIDREGMAAIRAAAQESGRLVLEAFMYRFAPRWRRALELVRDGAIGAPRITRVGFAFKQYPPSYNIRFDPAVGGGIEWDMGCYLTAMARDVFAAEPREVAAFGYARPGAAVTTSVEALLRFGDGRTAVTHASFDYPNPYSQVEIVGEDGWISLPGTGMRGEPFTRIVLHRGEDEIFIGEREPETLQFGYADPYRLEVEHFTRCVGGEAAPAHGLDDAAANLAAVLALIDAAHAGRTVPVRP